MMNLMNEMTAKTEILDKSIRSLRGLGIAHAQAKHDYQEALAKKILIERDKGTPVTIISDICRGDSHIAKLRFERDVAEVAYKAAMEAINGLKLQIKILNAQIEREWKA